jgi:hypothetical protein
MSERCKFCNLPFAWEGWQDCECVRIKSNFLDDDGCEYVRGPATQYYLVELENNTGFAVKSPDGRVVAAMFAGSPEDLLSARRQAEAACFSLNEISTPDSEKIT